MNLLGQAVNAAGEFLQVWNQVSGGVTSSGPAVIQDNVFIAQILESIFDDLVNGVEDDLLVQITGEGIPRVLTTHNVRLEDLDTI